jgi:CubicO group peptidase (beta-lactamase class C family)
MFESKNGAAFWRCPIHFSVITSRLNGTIEKFVSTSRGKGNSIATAHDYFDSKSRVRKVIKFKICPAMRGRMLRSMLSISATLATVVLGLITAGTQQETVTRPDVSQIAPAQIDATVTQLMSSAHVIGVGIAIFHDGRIAYLHAYGLRDTEKGAPLTPDSVMTSASLSKAAFATMVMRLTQEHLLDLDKPIDQYLPKPLPSYPHYADLAGDERYKKLTLRILLSHTSGFPN